MGSVDQIISGLKEDMPKLSEEDANIAKEII